MNRAEKLRRVMPGAPPELVDALGSKPAAEVNLIVAALRQARRDEREHQGDLRRERQARKREARKLAPSRRPSARRGARNDMILVFIQALADLVAEGDPDEALLLVQIEEAAHQAIGETFARMHAAGLSYGQIAATLTAAGAPVSRQAIRERVERVRHLSLLRQAQAQDRDRSALSEVSA